jgi:RNA polymerase sigma-70 factor (ECF subfamily)
VSAEGALRAAYPRALARVLRRTRDLPASEDAVQEAVARALERWPGDGIPDAPAAWLTTVALHHHTDGLRRLQSRDQHSDVLAELAARCPFNERLLTMPEAAGWDDDMLRLVFTCCDPLLVLEEQTALALATVCGLTTEEIARAFLVVPRTMEQRLTRARRRLRERRGQYEVPGPEAAPERLAAALAAIHFLFNEGYWSAASDDPIRSDVTNVALSLASSLDALLPEVPEVRGLLALLLLHAGRMPARVGDDGRPVSLEAQDRSRWHSETIDEACALLREALDRGEPGPYQIEAAIAAVHSSSPTADATDWREIEAFGAEAGMQLLEEVMDHPALAEYPYAHLVEGVLLAELGRAPEARRSLERAARFATGDAEREQIEARLAKIPK